MPQVDVYTKMTRKKQMKKMQKIQWISQPNWLNMKIVQFLKNGVIIAQR